MYKVFEKLSLEKEKKLSFLCLLLLVGSVLSLCVFNLTRLPYAQNYDSSVCFAQAKEIWEQKTLFIEDWSYQTSLNWDCPVPLAALFYGLLGNIFIAYGLADLVFIGAHLFVFLRICRDLRISAAARWFAASLYFTVFSHGQLHYADMLFTNGAFYSGRILAVFLSLSILLRLCNGATLHSEAFPIFCSLILTFLSSLSAGSYLLLCGIAPLFLWFLIKTLADDKLHLGSLLRPEAVYLLLTVFSAVLGLALIRFYAEATSSLPSTKVFCTAAELPNNILAAFSGILELFGVIDSFTNITILSLRGFSSLCSLALIVLLFASFYFILRSNLRVREHPYAAMTGCLLLVNSVVLCMGKLTYGWSTFEFRYWLLPLVPLFPLIGSWLDKLRLSANQSIYRFIFAVSIICSVFCSSTQLDSYWKEDCGIESFRSISEDISSETDIDTLCVVGAITESRLLNLCADDYRVISLNTNLHLHGWGSSIYGQGDVGALGDFMVLGRESELTAECPVLLQNLTPVKVYPERDLTLYSCTTPSILDTRVGFPVGLNSYSLDYVNSMGYYTTDGCGILQADGSIFSSGSEGFLLYGPYTRAEEGLYDVTIHYSFAEGNLGAAYFDVCADSGQRQLIREPLSENALSHTLHNVAITDGDVLEFRLFVEDNCLISVDYLEFRRSSPN